MPYPLNVPHLGRFRQIHWILILFLKSLQNTFLSSRPPRFASKKFRPRLRGLCGGLRRGGRRGAAAPPAAHGRRDAPLRRSDADADGGTVCGTVWGDLGTIALGFLGPTEGVSWFCFGVWQGDEL